MLSDINQWFLALGAEYGVNPYIFGAIYVGAIPFFLASIAWLVKRARAGRSTVVPTLLKLVLDQVLCVPRELSLATEFLS